MSRGLLIRLTLVVGLLVAAVFVTLFFLRPVATVAAVRRDTAIDAVPGTVTVRAERPYRVVAEVGGRIAQSDLKIGQAVTMGDLLVQMDSKATEIEIEQLQGQIAAVQKRIESGSTRQFELENNRDRLGFMEALLEKSAISPSDVESQRRAVRGLEQVVALDQIEMELQFANLKATLQLKENLLSKLALRSPIDGIVSRIEGFAGDLVAGGALIAEVISLTRVVEAKISEENFANVRVDQPATVRLAGFGDEKFDAKVSQTLPTADEETQRYTVHLEVTAEASRLVPGMTGEVLITVHERADALLVPRTALVGNHVYVVAEGRVQRRTVKTGYIALNDAEILEGVAEKEQVAIDNLDLLRDGARVRELSSR